MGRRQGCSKSDRSAWQDDQFGGERIIGLDILTHTLTGVAFASVIAAKPTWKLAQKSKAILLGGIAGALPDIDAISLWSKFDQTFGQWLHLSHTGREIYFGKLWYSHHGFFHSLAAALTLAMIFTIFPLFFGKIKNTKKELADRLPFFFIFCGAYVCHLIEDMPTPGLSWGGVNFLWPSNEYVGGTGQIWWWNNYDIFLIVAVVVFLNIFINLIGMYSKIHAQRWTWIVFILGALGIFFQINSRKTDFNSSNFTQNENISLEYQENLLPKSIYQAMVKWDKAVKVNF